MTTKERAIAALAKLRNRRVTRYSPAALDEELVDAVLDAIREPSEEIADIIFQYAYDVQRGADASCYDTYRELIDALKEGK